MKMAIMWYKTQKKRKKINQIYHRTMSMHILVNIREKNANKPQQN